MIFLDLLKLNKASAVLTYQPFQFPSKYAVCNIILFNWPIHKKCSYHLPTTMPVRLTQIFHIHYSRTHHVCHNHRCTVDTRSNSVSPLLRVHSFVSTIYAGVDCTHHADWAAPLACARHSTHMRHDVDIKIPGLVCSAEWTRVSLSHGVSREHDLWLKRCVPLSVSISSDMVPHIFWVYWS